MRFEELEGRVVSARTVAAAAAAAVALEDGLEMQILVSLMLLDEKVKSIPIAVANAGTDLDMYMNIQDADRVDAAESSVAGEPDLAT